MYNIGLVVIHVLIMAIIIFFCYIITLSYILLDTWKSNLCFYCLSTSPHSYYLLHKNLDND